MDDREPIPEIPLRMAPESSKAKRSSLAATATKRLATGISSAATPTGFRGTRARLPGVRRADGVLRPARPPRQRRGAQGLRHDLCVPVPRLLHH